MKNNETAKAAFTQKLGELNELARPSHNGQHLKEIVIYEKLLKIEEQLTMLINKIENK